MDLMPWICRLDAKDLVLERTLEIEAPEHELVVHPVNKAMCCYKQRACWWSWHNTGSMWDLALTSGKLKQVLFQCCKALHCYY